MKRIAILGCENSHANHFITAIKEREEFSDVTVVGVYSDDRAAAEKLNKQFGVPVMDNYADAVGKIDGLVITARHGNSHYKFAKPYIESGIPMFVDKPITIDEDEAIEFMQVAKANGVKVSGGSSLKQDETICRLKEEAQQEVNGKTVGGFMRAPLSVDNPHGGFFFYSQHLVEMVSEVFGKYPLSVTAKRSGDQLHVLFHYEECDCVGLYNIGGGEYYACRMAQEGSSGGRIPNDISPKWYYKEFKEFYDILSGTAESVDYANFIAPVMILNAIDRSMKSGKEEAVRKFEL